MADETAVSDTGPPLHLSEISEENLLKLFKSVTIPREVMTELTRYGVFDKVQIALNGILVIEQATQAELNKQRNAMLNFKVHAADLSVAALAARLLPDLVLTDDLALRKGLEAQDHTVVGSVGILVRAFKAGQLERSELLDCFNKLFDGSTLYLSKGFAVYIRKLLDSI